MDTASLIKQLEANARPVRRLPSPWARAALWFAVGGCAVAVVVVLMSPHPDLPIRFAEPWFWLEQTAALATAVLAAVAAFACTVPGRNRAICLLPLAPLSVWLASVGQGCVQEWLAVGPEALKLRVDWDCIRAAVPAGIVPAVAMVVMLRRGAPLSPQVTLAMGGIAVGALANAGLQLYHAGDASIMVLVWHLGSVALLSAIAGWAGRLVLRWPDPAGMLRELAKR
jgi:hypothetical protein